MKINIKTDWFIGVIPRFPVIKVKLVLKIRYLVTSKYHIYLNTLTQTKVFKMTEDKANSN